MVRDMRPLLGKSICICRPRLVRWQNGTQKANLLLRRGTGKATRRRPLGKLSKWFAVESQGGEVQSSDRATSSNERRVLQRNNLPAIERIPERKRAKTPKVLSRALMQLQRIDHVSSGTGIVPRTTTSLEVYIEACISSCHVTTTAKRYHVARIEACRSIYAAWTTRERAGFKKPRGPKRRSNGASKLQRTAGWVLSLGNTHGVSSIMGHVTGSTGDSPGHLMCKGGSWRDKTASL
ncbi:hypothetical protein V8F06_000619 [Rhypophila decipiens]